MSVPTKLKGKHEGCGGLLEFDAAQHRDDLLTGNAVGLAAVCSQCNGQVELEYKLPQEALERARQVDPRLATNFTPGTSLGDWRSHSQPADPQPVRRGGPGDERSPEDLAQRFAAARAESEKAMSKFMSDADRARYAAGTIAGVVRAATAPANETSAAAMPAGAPAASAPAASVPAPVFNPPAPSLAATAPALDMQPPQPALTAHPHLQLVPQPQFQAQPETATHPAPLAQPQPPHIQLAPPAHSEPVAFAQPSPAPAAQPASAFPGVGQPIAAQSLPHDHAVQLAQQMDALQSVWMAPDGSPVIQPQQPVDFPGAAAHAVAATVAPAAAAAPLGAPAVAPLAAPAMDTMIAPTVTAPAMGAPVQALQPPAAPGGAAIEMDPDIPARGFDWGDGADAADRAEGAPRRAMKIAVVLVLLALCSVGTFKIVSKIYAPVVPAAATKVPVPAAGKAAPAPKADDAQASPENADAAAAAESLGPVAHSEEPSGATRETDASAAPGTEDELASTSTESYEEIEASPETDQQTPDTGEGDPFAQPNE